jgi:hypothetical protein
VEGADAPTVTVAAAQDDPAHPTGSAMSYATITELNAWLGSDQPPPEEWDLNRILRQASRTVDRLTTAAYSVEDGLPTSETVAAALRDATCATVEYWMAVGGEDVDRMILGGPIGFDGASMSVMPSWHPPRAVEILRQAGLRGEPGIA